MIEPGITVFSYNSQFDDRTTMMLPELSVQGELHLGQFRPFIGGGAGGAFGITGNQGNAATLHAAGGARFDLNESWGLLGQMRVGLYTPGPGVLRTFSSA